MPERQPTEAVEAARDVLRQAAEAILALAGRLDGAFDAAVRRTLETRGRVVVTGMGKSGAIARKGAATLASTGTPALFLHPAEGVHGDLGMVTDQDLVVALSYSGETDEILAVLPALHRIGAPVIAVTGNTRSTLAERSEIVLDVSVEREACPLNLAPTTSTTAMLALLDALAVAVMRLRRFSREEYALFHPAGSLGRRLLLRVCDLMRTGEQLALCPANQTVRDALFVMTRAQSGSVFAVDENGRFLGLLSDGDIRRLWMREETSDRLSLADTVNRRPRTVSPDLLVADALRIMEQHPPCGELPVLDPDGRPVGVLNLKDVARAGILGA